MAVIYFKKKKQKHKNHNIRIEKQSLRNHIQQIFRTQDLLRALPHSGLHSEVLQCKIQQCFLKKQILVRLHFSYLAFNS